jgi:hypothetical protein
MTKFVVGSACLTPWTKGGGEGKSKQAVAATLRSEKNSRWFHERRKGKLFVGKVYYGGPNKTKNNTAWKNCCFDLLLALLNTRTAHAMARSVGPSVSTTTFQKVGRLSSNLEDPECYAILTYQDRANDTDINSSFKIQLTALAFH